MRNRSESNDPFSRQRKMKLKCSNCSKIFKSQLALKNHMKKHDKPYFCDVCKCRFTSKEGIENHMLVHGINHENQPHNDTRHRGKKYNESILSGDAEQRNIKVLSGKSYGDNKPKYFTKSERNIDKSDLANELPKLASATGIEDSYFDRTVIKPTKEPCAEDILKYNEQLGASVTYLKEGNRREAQQSEKAKHSFKHSDKNTDDVVENTSAEYAMKDQTSCLKGLDLSKTIKSNKPHLERNTYMLNDKSQDHRCMTCNKFYRIQNSLTRCNCKASIGNELETECQNKYFCMVCNKAYSSVSTYTHHACKSQDDRIKKKTCHVCDKSFKTNEHLRQHMRKHSGEKPYLCGSCGKSFSQQGNLIKHTRIHEGNRMFLCEICSRPFMTKSALTEHLRIHADEKAYNCGTCGKLFRHKHGLVHHLRNRKFPCNIRKYGERKLKKETGKDACLSNIDNGKKKKKSRLSNMKKMVPSNSGVENNIVPSYLGVEQHFEKLDMVNKMKVNNDTHDVYSEAKPLMGTGAYSTVSNSEHGIKKLQNFIEIIHPCSKTDDSLKNACLEHEYTRLEGKQISKVQNKYILIDKTKTYPIDRDVNIAEHCEQTVTMEKASNTPIERILMQNYQNEISPALHEKRCNSHALQFGMESCKLAFNPLLKTTETKLDSRDHGFAEENSSSVNREHGLALQNPRVGNDMSTSVENESERLVFTGSLTCRPKLTTGTSDYSSYLVLPFQKSGKYTVDTETLKKRNDNLKLNKGSESIRNIHLAAGNTVKIVSNFENENSGLESINNWQNKGTIREENTSPNNILSGDSMTDSIGDNEYIDETDMITTEAHSRNQTNNTIHRESLSKSNRPTVEINEEEVLKIIEKAQAKDFRCWLCNRKFSNDYCLSVHNCKTKEVKPKFERKHCDRCNKSYANKYLLASHSCKSNRNVNQARISKRKQKLQERGTNSPLSPADTRCREILCKTELETKSNTFLKSRNVERRKRERINNRSDRKQRQNMKETEQESKPENDAPRGAKFQYDAVSEEDTDSAKILSQMRGTDRIKTLGQNEDKMICETCGKTYKNKVNLKNHSCKPLPEETRTCKVCGKLFNVKVHLQIHMRIHTGELPFLCKFCGKRFNQSANLMKHMRIHNPDKLFKCEICGRQFTQKGALTEHRVVHTSIKPYNCSKCNKAFRHKHGLQNHLNRKFPCDKKKKKADDIADKKDKESITESEKDQSQSNRNISGKWNIYDTKKGQNICFKNDAVPNHQISDIERKSVDGNHHMSGSAADSEVDNPTTSQSGGSEQTYYQSSNVQTLNETIKNNNGQSGAEDQLAQLPESISVTKHNPESSESCEIYIQQPHPGYVMSYGMPAGWITLNCKLVDL